MNGMKDQFNDWPDEDDYWILTNDVWPAETCSNVYYVKIVISQWP